MKIFFLLLLSILVLHIYAQDNEFNHIQALKGNIKVITIYEYTTEHPRKTLEDWEIKARLAFDSLGRCIELSEMLFKWTFKHSYTYDDNDKLIKEINFTPNGSIQNEIFYLYNNKGKKIQDSIIFYDTSQYIPSTINSKYNRRYEYNSQDKLILMVDYKPDGKIFSTYNYSYDSNGNSTEEIIKYNSKKIKIINKYKFSGNKILQLKSQDGRFSDSIIYQYNSDENLAIKLLFGQYKCNSEKAKNGDSPLFAEVKYQYSYDKKGNWTKCEEREKCALTKITERKIEYYE